MVFWIKTSSSLFLDILEKIPFEKSDIGMEFEYTNIYGDKYFPGTRQVSEYFIYNLN